MPQGTDPDTNARLDDLAARMGAIDTISAQVAQLSARVAAQAHEVPKTVSFNVPQAA